MASRLLVDGIVKKEQDDIEHTKCGLLFYSKPSFFKVLIGDYSEKLNIPSLFARKCLDIRVGKCKSFELDTCQGKWTVTASRTSKGVYFFEEGWPAFVGANELEFGDFLVFFLTGLCSLNVVMYNKTTCAKHYRLPGSKRNRKTSTGTNSYKRHLYEVTVTLKKYNKYNMALPKEFVRNIGLAGIAEVELLNQDSRSWMVLVRGWRLGPGWTRFYIENSLASGDKCVFRCTSDTGRGSNSLKIEFLKLDEEKARKGK